MVSRPNYLHGYHIRILHHYDTYCKLEERLQASHAMALLLEKFEAREMYHLHLFL